MGFFEWGRWGKTVGVFTNDEVHCDDDVRSWVRAEGFVYRALWDCNRAARLKGFVNVRITYLAGLVGGRGIVSGKVAVFSCDYSGFRCWRGCSRFKGGC